MDDDDKREFAKINLAWIGLTIAPVIGVGLLYALVALIRMPHEITKKIQDETIKQIGGCTDHWRPECAHLDFRPLNGIEKRYLIQTLPASASIPSEVVCEENATGELCSRVHWP
jgi:hypothetical protein